MSSSSVPSRVERSAVVLPFGYAPDWDAVTARVRASGATGPGDQAAASTIERERESLVMTFALYLSAQSPGRAAASTRTSVRQLATLAGLREDRARQCLSRLAHAGVLCDGVGGPLAIASGAPMWDDHLVARLADAVLRPAPAAHVVRWDVVRERAGGSSRALAATAAFLDLLPVPAEWTSVSLAAVGAVARYTGRKVGEAVQRAIACGVVDERREPGSASLYRLSPEVLHVAAAPAARPAPPPIPARPSAPPVERDSVERDSVERTSMVRMRPVESAVTLMVRGIAFPLPPTARPQLEQADDGQYWYRVGSVHIGPVTFD